MLYYFSVHFGRSWVLFPLLTLHSVMRLTRANRSPTAISSLTCACVVRFSFWSAVIIMRRTCLISLFLTWGGWQKYRGDQDSACCLEPSPDKPKLEHLTSVSHRYIWARILDFHLSHWVWGSLFHRTIGNTWPTQWPVRILYYYELMDYYIIMNWWILRGLLCFSPFVLLNILQCLTFIQ